MSYTLLVGGHNCIIAGDFIKKNIRLLSQKHIVHTTHYMHNMYYIHYIHDIHNIHYMHEIHYIVYIFYIVDLLYIEAYNIEKKKIRYKKSAIYTRLPTD